MSAKENKCYDPDCKDKECYNPEHFNYICMDPACNDTHCEEKSHYDRTLLENYQSNTDFSVYDHKEDIDYSEDVDVKICNCDDCADDDDDCHDDDCHDDKCHDDDCDDDDCKCHDDDCHDDKCHDDDCDDDDCKCHDDDCHDDKCHDDDCDDDDCKCHDDDCHDDDCDDDDCKCHDDDCHDDDCDDDDCKCHDDDDIKICNCDDCADDDDDEEEVIKEGVPLIKNRSIQIIVSSGILFVLGHVLNHYAVYDGILATIVFAIAAIISGYDIAVMAKNSLIKRHTISPAVLMCIAAVAAFLIGHPEEGAAVTFLYFISEFLEDYSEERAQHSIKSLVEIAPDTARVKNGDEEEIRPVEEVHVNEVVIVRPGDKVPLDGKIIKGVSAIDQASITGESVPVTKTVDDEVYSGTINQDGYLEVLVTKEAKDTVISKIVTLVKRSQLNRSHTETLVEKIAKYYTPIIVVITVCVAFIPPLVYGADLTSWVYRALSLMVISCPCAFLISTPIGMVSAITSATRKGVLIKGSNYVEEMRQIKAVIFDKTGTLTEGKLELTGTKLLSDKYDENQLVEIAASLESKSSHPIAQAIVNYADDNNITLDEIENFKNVPGKGIIGTINNKEYYAANEALIEGSNFNIEYEEIHKYAADGKTIIFVGDKTEIIGIITVMDKIRDESEAVIRNLNNEGIKTVMLTGDNKIAAKTVADEIGVNYVFSDLLPEDKLNILDTVRNKFGDVAMVGDGVNDAPALARSNIGIAMGAAGSDVAIDTADIALMQDDLTKLPYLFSLSTKTDSIIRENIITALTVKFIFIILAVLGLITLMMAVGIGDMGLTLLVILNSFRIGIVKDPIF